MHLPASRRQTLPEKLAEGSPSAEEGVYFALGTGTGNEKKKKIKEKHEPDAFDGLACEIFGFT